MNEGCFCPFSFAYFQRLSDLGFGVTPSIYTEKHKRHPGGIPGHYMEDAEDTVALYGVLFSVNPRKNVILAITSK